MADEQESVKETKIEPAEWQKRDQIKAELELELRPRFRVEYETLFKLWKEDELDKVRKESEKIANDGIAKLFNKWKEEQKPPTDEDIQLLLSQEYGEFNIQIRTNTNGTVEEEHFVLRELPQEAEVKLYSIFIDRVMKKASLLQSFTQEGMDQPFEQRVESFLELFKEFPDLMAESVVIILDPFTEKKHINRKWVQRNISSNRQWNIIEAQIKVNRIKDFFSKLSQSGQQTQTMLGGLNFQQLQQLAR